MHKEVVILIFILSLKMTKKPFSIRTKFYFYLNYKYNTDAKN